MVALVSVTDTGLANRCSRRMGATSTAAAAMVMSGRRVPLGGLRLSTQYTHPGMLCFSSASALLATPSARSA